MNNFQTLVCYLAIVLILAFSGNAFAKSDSKTSSDNTEYFGKFETELIPDTRQLFRLVLKPLKKSENNKFAKPPEKNSLVTAGKMIDLRKSGGSFEVALIESVKNSPTICVDIDGDLKFVEKECFAMAVSKDNSNDFEYTLKLPIETLLFKKFPIFLKYKRGFTAPKIMPDERVLMQSLLGYANGRVDINGRSVLVQYQLDPREGTIDTTQGLMGIDVDGNGEIKNEPFSFETSYASDDEIVFRLGNIFLSTVRLDAKENQIVMRERKAEEYRRIELEIGKTMPDFSFVDFENKKRTLSEFRGKYLMVDFWGLWCIDCVRELPYQIEAYKRFRSRGFEILGIDTDEETEKVKGVLQKNNINWTQARFDSIKELVETSYRIQEYPSAILLGPDGKVLVLEQNLLKGEELLKTIERILPQ